MTDWAQDPTQRVVEENGERREENGEERGENNRGG